MRLVTLFLITTGVLAQPTLMSEEEFLYLNDDMKAFLAEHVSSYHASSQRLHALVFSIFGKDGLGLTYGNQTTKTPIETYETRNGNCMSFTTMFVAMARHVGIRAYFQEVEDFPTWDKRGEVVINNKHMNAVVMVDGRVMEVDFLPYQNKRRRYARRISDTKAMAHYYNNKGAEAFAAGDRETARVNFEFALKLDGEFARAWSNMGVLQRHEGALQQAETCYLNAIEYNRFEYTAMSNLAYLYQATGREELAKKYASKVERYRNRNPFYHFDIAHEAHLAGNLEEAIHSYKRAINLRPKESDFYHAIAQVYYELGDSKQVEKNLKLAERFALTPDEKLRYSSKLDFLAAK
ncbi:MAG: tetratricopeptide repeat protein [Acidobacteria bacterium]|nr:tetratricopeptide repeat protein [Acidobacteriota bacterium]